MWFICLACWSSLMIHFITVEQFPQQNVSFPSLNPSYSLTIHFVCLLVWSLSKHFPLKNFLFINTAFDHLQNMWRIMRGKNKEKLFKTFPTIWFLCWLHLFGNFFMLYFCFILSQVRRDIKNACKHSLNKSFDILCHV